MVARQRLTGSNEEWKEKVGIPYVFTGGNGDVTDEADVHRAAVAA